MTIYMYCPKCKCEYRDGFTICSECHVSLVKNKVDENLTIEEPKKIPLKLDKFAPMLTTNNPIDSMLIRSIFDFEKINYYFHENNTILNEICLYVSEKDQIRAKEILGNLKLTYTRL